MYIYCYVLKLLLQFLLFMLWNVICTSEYMYPQSHKVISAIYEYKNYSNYYIQIKLPSFVDLSSKLSRIN